MRITKWVEVETEVNIDLSREDLECIISSKEAADPLPWIRQHLNDIAQFLKAIPDSKIAEMTAQQRVAINEFLVNQSKRFEEGGAR
jgi:hypothetical protein